MKILVKIKPLTIVVPEEREEVYEKLKTALRRAEEIANDERLKAKTRVEALRLVAYICQVIFGVLKDVQLEDIEKRLEKLEEEAGES